MWAKLCGRTVFAYSSWFRWDPFVQMMWNLCDTEYDDILDKIMPFHLYDNGLCSSSCFIMKVPPAQKASAIQKLFSQFGLNEPDRAAQGQRFNKETWNTGSDLDPVHHLRDELWSVLALTNAAVAEWEQPRAKPAGKSDTRGVEDVIVADSWSWFSCPHTFA